MIWIQISVTMMWFNHPSSCTVEMWCLSVVFSDCVKEYRASVARRQELERKIKAEKYKMSEKGSSSDRSLTYV